MRPFGTTIFAEMSALAVRTGAVNLGQGFPDTDGPPEMLEAAAEALAVGPQPVPAGPGHPGAARGGRRPTSTRFWGLTYDPDGEVLVTAGATEAIAAAILALCEPGDEVVCFEPYYDSYAASHRAGRRGPPAGHPAPGRATGGTPSTRTTLRAAFGAAYPAGAAQLAAQPDRQGLHPRPS